MSENSTIGRLILTILRNGSIGAAVLMVLFIGIEIWKHITPDQGLVIASNDRGFIGVLLAILLFAFYLIWSIGKELKKPRA